MSIYQLSKQELSARVGHMAQIAGIKRYTMKEGKKGGTDAVDMWNGRGLYLTVVCDRASDIASLTYQGKSLCWLSNLGISSPAYRTKGDFEWNNNFSGGMFATCGLNTAGLPSLDDGEHLELHGPVSNLPSEEIGYRTYWEGDDYFMEYEGRTYQSRPFGENLCLTRTITLKMGENVVRVRDRVENLGFKRIPFMVIYHMNFGYPLLDTGSSLYLNYEERFPTSSLAADSVGEIGRITEPDEGYAARAYNHIVRPDGDGYGCASILNPELGLGATVKFDTGELDHFNLWKCLQKSSYVVGMEPCNCRTWGRDKERENRHLTFLEPFETRELYFEIQIHDGAEEIERAAGRYTEAL